jgi:hypothetical protein
MMIVIDVTKENAKQVLKRKQNGENICPNCTKRAMKLILEGIIKLPGV